MGIAIAPPDQRGYAHPEMLATTDWLAERLDDPGVRVVDVDAPDAYPRVHIAGAVPVEDHYFKRAADPVRVQGPEEFARTMSQLGIGDETTVVAYDSEGGHYAARLYWALRYYGHADVRVLDGGFPKWFAEGGPVERKPNSYPPARFTPSPAPELIKKKTQVLESIEDTETVLWDVRSDEEWTGENDRGTARGGRLPGAVHLEWKNLVNQGDVPTIKPAAELRAMLEELGITPEKRVVTY